MDRVVDAERHQQHRQHLQERAEVADDAQMSRAQQNADTEDPDDRHADCRQGQAEVGKGPPAGGQHPPLRPRMSPVDRGEDEGDRASGQQEEPEELSFEGVDGQHELVAEGGGGGPAHRDPVHQTADRRLELLSPIQIESGQVQEDHHQARPGDGGVQIGGARGEEPGEERALLRRNRGQRTAEDLLHRRVVEGGDRSPHHLQHLHRRAQIPDDRTLGPVGQSGGVRAGPDGLLHG